jgi:AraC-like DNA-binding protein
MLFRSYKPGAPLCEFVEDFWLYQGYAGEHARERILPSGTVEVVVNLNEDELRIYGPHQQDACRRYSGTVISGPYARAFMSDAAEETSIMGVHFRPGGAFPILGIPGGELTNIHLDLTAVWGQAAADLREQLIRLAQPTKRFQLLERNILERLCGLGTRHSAVRPALDMLIRTNGQAKTRDIAKAVDLSQARLIKVFTSEVGLRPKLFGRVQRFQHAVGLARNAPIIDWAQIATDCGYFDQSHLIRDFVEFSGVSPADYQQRQARLDRAAVHVKRNHLPFAE